MKACVLGCGISGKGAITLLKKKGHEVFGIDRVLSGLENIVSEDEVDFTDVDLMVVSPGVSLDHVLIKQARSLKIEVIGEIELGLRYLNSFCIGVTGTNGKTTTCELITHLLNDNNIEAVCLGNCGTSLCSEVANIENNTVVVLELSSYQIEWINSKKIALGCILNIEEDHLDRYQSFADYARAKLGLLDSVKEKVWIKKDVLQKVDLLQKDKTKLFDKKQIVATLNELGYTNKEVVEQENLFAAWQMVKGFLSKEQFCKSVATFTRPKHRLEKIGMFNSVDIYNDSKSTNPASVYYALETIEKKIVLLLGGEDKNLGFSKLLQKREKISRVICFGKAKNKIAQELTSLNPLVVSTVKDATKLALKLAEPNEAIVFSPGCSSFDAFKDYQERGNFFKKSVLQYVGEK